VVHSFVNSDRKFFAQLIENFLFLNLSQFLIISLIFTVFLVISTSDGSRGRKLDVEYHSSVEITACAGS